MDLGAFHPRNLFSWRSSLSDTRRLDEQTPTADAQAVTVKLADLARCYAVFGLMQILTAGPLATKRFTGTLRASQKDASKWDKVPGQNTRRLGEHGNTAQQNTQYNRHPPVAPTLTRTLTDLAGKVKGMYRLLDLIGESGSNGYVDKVIISQDSLQHFINAVSPGAYTSITKVDFKALDRFMIRPLGVYGSKDGIVHLLRSIGVVDEDIATSLLSPSDVGNSRATLSSGLYIVKANATDLVDERHYVIYWPEDSTWNDSANSSVRRNRVTFMRYLTKICDQVVALLTPEQSVSIVWNEERNNVESADIDVSDDSDRLFTFEVAETNEQEESAVARPGFQLNSPYISPGETPPECPVDPATLAPRLLPGETRHAFWTATYVPHQNHAEILDEHTFTQVALKQLLMNSALVLSENLDGNAVQILVGVAIAERFPEQCDKWRAINQGARTKFMQELTERKETVRKEVIRGEDSLRRVLHEAVVEDVIGLFPSLERDRLSQAFPPPNSGGPKCGSGCRNVYQKHVQNARFGIALRRDSYFENRKLRLVAALLKGDFHRAQNLLSKTDGKKRADSGGWSVGNIFSGGSGDFLGRDMRMLAGGITDSQFLLDMKSITETEARPATQEIETLAHAQLASTIDAAVKAMTRNVLAMQQEYCTRSIQHEMESEERKSLNNALIEFIRDVNAQSSGRQDSVVYIDGVIATQSVGWRDPAGYYDDVEVEWGTRLRSHYGQEYVVTGRQEVLQEPRLEYWVYPMDLTSDDKHNMQLDPNFCQVLENEKLLLILVDQVRVAIYLERFPAMDVAIERHRPVKVLSREKLEEDILFAFDETKRTLAVCAPTKLHFHMFVFDETFKTLQGQGSGVNLAPWYKPSFRNLYYAHRFSSVAFPAPYSRLRTVLASSLFTLRVNNRSLTAYHWETFGSTTGIALDVPKFPLRDAVLTSLVGRGRVFLLGLDVDSSSVKSIAIDITKKLTEFMFKENGSRNASNNKARHTLHNSLLDCHAEVWSRYPVLAAVRRRTVTSLSERKQKSLTFITEDDSRPFNAYFSDLIQTFERTTRKPTGDELRRIKVSAEQFGVFRNKVALDPDWDVSRYRVGEWLVDVFCLIPIHIAVCRENRFVPLANGVLSSDLERTLLGAEVNKIVDKLSFGWYESIFQSYMATKPVKVVSSMGQQSVGKSFALNHLLDTSFAGSAMRTTEGVWMSVTPTDDALVVALDFEGVDSVERSLQEDTLLVLFNTAISNLDVVESDKVEITREFSLKFQKIVQQEQRANFISRLHRGRLNIIPWPVIESREFYNLFSTLKRRLDLQSVSHPTAGEFLHTIKTLMAKLKLDIFQQANDWGALSQTMTEHRAKTLSTLLPIALATGFSEIEPDFEPLKNLDTDLEIEGNDTDSRFAISGREQISPMDVEMHLSVLLESWNQSMPRQFTPDSEWIERFVSHLHGLIDLRVNYVRLWLDSNLERFQDGHATIEDLLRSLQNCSQSQALWFTVAGHVGDEHKCSALVHMCGEPCALQEMKIVRPGKHILAQKAVVFLGTFLLQMTKNIRLAKVTCVVKRIRVRHCAQLQEYVKLTQRLCLSKPQFTGRHETFQYTKLQSGSSVSRPSNQGECHTQGPHIHNKEKQIFHFCETRCQNCGYFCTLPLGHTQQEHETSHGSMTQTRWAIDGPDETGLELGGRKFSSNDEGAPMMCNLVCSSMGRHVHIDYCRAGENAPCDGAEVQHINARMVPNPDKPKDAITHSLYWRRRDPYTRDEQTNFAKCDAMCSGPEHSATSGQPSYCTLPLFHPPKRLEDPVNGSGYISSDGHLFDCRSPAVMQQAFHVIFVIDKSGSMDSSDRKPLVEGPAAERIQARSNNRLGAVYSALYSFWSARHAAVAAGQRALGTQRGLDSVYSALYSFWSARNAGATGVQEPTVTRRDAYSVILFNDFTTNVVVNDFTSSPGPALRYYATSSRLRWNKLCYSSPRSPSHHGAKLEHRKLLEPRIPIMIFLSDGQSAVSDEVVQDLCRSALRLGKQLSFHAVSFGPDSSVPILRKMAQIALGIQESAPQNAGLPAAASVPPSSFATALDTVRLTETFLGIADSMRKPRGSLVH
ncbi:hypothetical protein EDB83DRAFT_2317547 [Lactarius deliciosus]|nr:hypothetical protein EDB83DRAFT_2317547 [Lactarius deliciosus]